MSSAVAAILAGGQGKRMGKLCLHRPKPTLPFAGIYRVIDFALSNCLHSQIDKIAVLTDYQRSYMASYLRLWGKYNALNEDSMDILEADSHYLGTADALFQNLEYLRNRRADTVLVLAADHVYKMDYRQMLSFHKLNKADVTVGVVPMPPEKARPFGTVTVGSGNRILDFVEKAETPKNNLVSMGIYVFDIEAIATRLSEDARDPDSAHDFGYSIIPAMVKHDRAFAYKFDGYWRDIGTIESYHEANRELACRQSSFSLDGNWLIATAQERLSATKVSSEGKIYNSIVSPGCVIKGCVENSVLSPGVRVEENAVVRNSVLMGNTFIGRHSRVESCIVDEGVSVGRFCRIGARSSQPIIPEAITVLEKDLTVPSDTSIRPNESDLLEDNMTECTTASHATELSYAVAR